MITPLTAGLLITASNLAFAGAIVFARDGRIGISLLLTGVGVNLAYILAHFGEISSAIFITIISVYVIIIAVIAEIRT